MSMAALRPTEREFQGMVIQTAHLCGWLVYHTWLSKHSTAGFPDLVLVRPPRPVLFVELKSEIGRVTAAQELWMAQLGACPGVQVCLWRPSDWDALVDVLR